jgi:iron complex outermembrane receptor protein
MTKKCTALLPSSLVFGMLIVAESAVAQTQDDLLSPGEMKKLSIEQLMDMEVMSVSKKSEKLTTVASAVQVITQDDIRNSGATSVPEVLRLAPNLQVAQVNASQWAISARGFNNVLANKLLVLIDGRTVYTPLYAGVFWDVQNILLEDIERIEVISGPGGTLWGANAVNGVINITTKNAGRTSGLYVEGAAGNELRGYGGLRYGGKLAKDLYYRVYGTAFKRDDTILSEDHSDAKDGWTMGQGGFRMDWDASEKNQVSFQANYYDNRPDPDGGTPVEAKGCNISGRWNRSISENSDFQLQVYYDQTWRDFRNGFTENLKTYDIDGQHRFQVGQHQEVVWGVGLRLMDHLVENLELFGFFPANRTLHVYNVFAQDNITLVEDRLHFTVGVKVEHNNYTSFQYQPSGRISWTPTERQTIWGAVSRAVRTPSRIDRDFALYIAPGLPFIEANDDFKSEEVLAYEAGWRMQFQEKTSLSLATFYNDYDNIRSAEPGPNLPPLNIPITFANGVKGTAYGVEFSGTHQLTDRWRLRAGYTFLKKDLSVKSTSQDLNNGSAEANDPEHQFLVQSMTDLRYVELGIVLRYVDRLAEPEKEVDNYVGLDVRLAWKLPAGLELSVVGQNILEKHHPEFIPSSPSPRDIERSFYGKIAWRFSRP